MIHVANIFESVLKMPRQEQFATLFETEAVKVERIVSQSYGAPEDFWYDQPHVEWVIVLRGEAELEFEGGNILRLKAGDYLIIPSHARHRVRRTSAETFWLAVHARTEGG
jgi:cupin 2 domain-containing protein